MIRPVMLAAALGLGVTAVVAQSEAIAERQRLMKAQGQATGGGAKMLKGEEAFDLAKAKSIFETYLVTTSKFADLFPEDSKTGGKTRALPTIWQDRTGFNATLAKFDADAKAGLAATTNLDTFRAAFQRVTTNCQACHEKYRAPQN